MELMLATRNLGKVREFRKVLEPLGFKVVSLRDMPLLSDIEEDLETFTENALKKAREVAWMTQMPVLADDSGLVVDILDGRPGVFSSRYAGNGATDADNVRKLLDEMKGIPLAERGAHYFCAIALICNNTKEEIFEGRCDGIIGMEPLGRGGFGYDPVFYLPQIQRTMSELSWNEKNRISHRGKALVKVVSRLEELFLSTNPADRGPFFTQP